jgi:hypothetical protein
MNSSLSRKQANAGSQRRISNRLLRLPSQKTGRYQSLPPKELTVLAGVTLAAYDLVSIAALTLQPLSAFIEHPVI